MGGQASKPIHALSKLAPQAMTNVMGEGYSDRGDREPAQQLSNRSRERPRLSHLSFARPPTRSATLMMHSYRSTATMHDATQSNLVEAGNSLEHICVFILNLQLYWCYFLRKISGFSSSFIVYNYVKRRPPGNPGPQMGSHRIY